MKRIYSAIKIISILFFISTRLNAQDNFTLLEDNPYLNSVYFNVGFGLNTKTFSKYCINYRQYFADAKFRMDVAFNFNISKQKNQSYYDQTFSEAMADPFNKSFLHTNEKLKSGQNWEIGGVYFYKRELRLRKVHRYLSKYRSGPNEETHVYLSSKLKALKMVGIRMGAGGHSFSFYDYYLKSNASEYSGFTAGSEFENAYPNYKIDGIMSNVIGLFAYIGIQRSIVTNNKISGLIHKRSTDNEDAYFDILFPISNRLSGVQLNHNSQVYHLSEMTKKLSAPIGFRMGITTRPVRHFRINTAFEIGSMPGYKIYAQNKIPRGGNDNNLIAFYFQFRASLGITGKWFKQPNVDKFKKRINSEVE